MKGRTRITKDPASLQLAFGALVPSLAVQLDRRSSDVALWQKDADAITRLLVRGFLSDGAGRTARRKLMRVIVKGTG